MEGRWIESKEVAPALYVSQDDVIIHVKGFFVLRAVYEAEGFYEEADGDPEEQDLFRVEVLDASRAVTAGEAVDDERVWPLSDLGLTEPTIHRLLPAARWSPDGDPMAPVVQYLMVLAFGLVMESLPGARQRVLEESVRWAPDRVNDALRSLPSSWQAVLHDEWPDAF